MLTTIFNGPIPPIATNNPKLFENVGLVPMNADLLDKPIFKVYEMNLHETLILCQPHEKSMETAMIDMEDRKPMPKLL